MKPKVWLSIALSSLTAVSVLAQPSNPVPPPIDVAPAAPAPASTPAAKPAAAKPAKPAKAKKAKAKSSEPAKVKKAKAPLAKTNMVLNPPVTATVTCDVLDVRGRGSFAGEVITHVKKGETVTVLEQITLDQPRANEPANWSRIEMPSNAPVWISTALVDPETKAVRVKKANVRGGPGENYSVVGRLDKGTVVKQIRQRQDWTEIETPADVCGFVASQYLENESEAPAPVAAPVAAPVVTAAPVAAPAPAPVAAPVVVNVPAEAQPPVPAKPVEVVTPAPAPVAPVASATLVAPAPTTASQADQELAALRRATASEPVVTQPAFVPPPVDDTVPRVVTREGFLHRAYNIQAPADFELHDIKTGDLIDYIQPAKGQKLKIYVGTRVQITGSESLDKRWARTPILQVQSVDLMP
jgi:hypothetical protein